MNISRRGFERIATQNSQRFAILDCEGVIKRWRRRGLFDRTKSELPYETLMEDGEFSVRNYPRHSELRSEAVGTRDEARNRSLDLAPSGVEELDDRRTS